MQSLFFNTTFKFENQEAEILAVLDFVKTNWCHIGIPHLKLAAYLKQKSVTYSLSLNEHSILKYKFLHWLSKQFHPFLEE